MGRRQTDRWREGGQLLLAHLGGSLGRLGMTTPTDEVDSNIRTRYWCGWRSVFVPTEQSIMPFQPSPNTASFSYHTQTQQNPKFNSINPVPVLPIPTALPRGEQSCRSVRTSATLCHSANASGVMYSFMGMCRLLGRRYCPNVTTSHPTALRSLRVASTSAGVSPTPSISDVFVITCGEIKTDDDDGPVGGMVPYRTIFT